MVKDPIDQNAVGARYAAWFSGVRGIALRYLFSRRGLWVINTPYRRILRAAGIGAGDRVLDLGCGIANLLIALAERIPFEVRPVGVDVSPDLIALGKRELGQRGLTNRIELAAAPATALPFEDGRLDVVFTSHVIKHLDDAALDQCFREVARVLRPGGRFLLWEFRPSPFSAPLFWSAALSGLPPRFVLRSPEELTAALLAAGFADVRRVPSGIFLMPPVPRLALLARTPRTDAQ
jgi:ubiquinone/menaquinone biosynthesis C-methylase UbiE